MLTLGNVLIIGDSYSTFSGEVPEGNNVWYSENGKNGVYTKNDTWWGQLILETKTNFLLNESFSGSTVCNTERPTIPHTSFCYRLDALIEKGFFIKHEIDTIFIFGGTNDSWTDAPLGDILLDGITEERKKEVFPAFAYLIKTLQAQAPTAKIIPILNCDINPLISTGFAQIADRFGVKSLQLTDISKKDGHPDKTGMKQIEKQIVEFLAVE